MRNHCSALIKRVSGICLLLVLSFTGNAQAQKWQVVWADEFNAAKNVAIDSTKWTAESGGSGWGNQELQYYTNSINNTYHDGKGSLLIKAISEIPANSQCWYGSCQYSSARLVTKGKFDYKYGRFEARIKSPSGQGLWPAFWMLGNNIDQVGWPKCGEIDIMENIGREPSIVHGTIHGPGYSGGNSIEAPYTLPNGQRFSDDFHVYKVEWEPNAIRWYVDGNLYQTRTPNSLPAGTKWVYDHPFFLILNLAVGGSWPGNPDQNTTFPQTMLVDYLRVYKLRFPNKP